MTKDLPPAVVCRVCGCPRLLVEGTRITARGTVRYRRCPDCGAKYKTCERIEARLSAARNPVADRLDRAAGVAVEFLKATDEDGVQGDDLYGRVRRRVPLVTFTGFTFRMGDDPRVVLGDDGKYRLRTE